MAAVGLAKAAARRAGCVGGLHVALRPANAHYTPRRCTRFRQGFGAASAYGAQTVRSTFKPENGSTPGGLGREDGRALPLSSDSPDSARWFAEEVQPHAAELRGWLRGKFPALTDPDNLAQEALTRVWKTHAAGPVPSPKALLFTTARHLALDELRRRQIVTFEAVTEIADLPVYEDNPTAADQAARNQELEILTQAIQSLPDRCRQVLTLRKIYGLSQREIAAQLGISENTVEVQVANGMRKCTVFLARRGLP